MKVERTPACVCASSFFFFLFNFLVYDHFLMSYFFFFQYPDYLDAYLRLAAIAKARNNIQRSIELVYSLFQSFDSL